MQIKKINIDNSFPLDLINEMELLIDSVEFSPIWQSVWWNLMLLKSWYSKKWFFIWVYDELNKLINYVIIEQRKVIWNKYWHFIIWSIINNQWKTELEKEIQRLSVEEKAIFTQIETLNEIELNSFKKWYYKKFIESNTAIITLSNDEDTILSNMKQKWRYNIKIATKNNVKVEKKENTESNLNIFLNLLKETTERDWFFVNSENYYKIFLEYLYQNNLGWLYFASKDNDVIAAWIFVFFHKTCYYYYWASTSDNEKRKYMATYLLQWEVIKEAKINGYKNFDFLWIAWNEDKSKRLVWVTDFKLKLTNETKKWPMPYIMVHNNLIYCILKLKTYIKKFTRK